MKLLALLLALPLGLAADPADKLVAYYHTHDPSVDEGLLRYVVAETQRLAKVVDHPDHVETMLAMWHVESRYDQKSDDGQSYGIAQTRKDYEAGLRKWWLSRRVSLGSFDDPTAQVAFGVAEFSKDWYYARKAGKGRLWEAVMRYNGSGRAARRHADRVFKARKAIFGISEPPRSKR